MAMAEPADLNVDELRRRARRRLVGAVVLALAVAVVVPMLLETEQKPLGDDVAVKIPPIDEGKFVNRLSENRAKDAARSPPKTSTTDAAKDATTLDAGAPERAAKYDTRLPEAQPGSSTPAVGAAAKSAASDATTPPATSAAPVSGPSDRAPTAADKSGDGKASSPERSAGDAAKSPLPAAQPDAKAGTASNSTGTVNPAAPATPKSNAAAPMVPSPTRSATNPSPSPVDAKAAAPHDGFAVQLAAFADDKGANALAGRLKRAGYTAYTEPLKTSKGTLWRVRVGPYPSRDAAVAARDKLKTEGQSGIVAAIK